MGKVDLHFQPTVPVFDANMHLGRPHDRRVTVHTAEGTLEAMKKAGVGKALVHHPHADFRDSHDGNGWLMELIEGEPAFVPQFVCNPSFDNLDEFAAEVEEHGVRSVRLVPTYHMYPFRDWVLGRWLEWFADQDLAVWIQVNPDSNQSNSFDPSAVHDTIKDHPNLKFVLSEFHYQIALWVYPFLRSLPNVYAECSKFISTNWVPEMIEVSSVDRVLYGSGFPTESLAPQLYTIHRSGLSDEDLAAVCGGNLERLLNGA
jgi:predicted TIM-barrel fold metal-dependent hydrolase